MDDLRRKIRIDLERPFLDGFRIGSLILAAYFLILIPVYLLDSSNIRGSAMALVNVCVFLVMITCHLLLRTNRVKPIQGPRIALVLVCTVLAQILLHLFLNRNFFLTSDLMLLIVAVALILHRSVHYLAIICFTLITWVIAACLLPDSGHLIHWTIGMTSAMLVSVAIHITLRGVLGTQEKLRYQDLLREKEKAELISRLEALLENVKTLRGLIPICAHCKRVRNDTGYWQQVEQYVKERSDANFSHGICPDCEPKIREQLIREGLLPAPQPPETP